VRMDLLLEEVDVVRSVGDIASVEVTSIELDSRHVGPGALFCCLPGTITDGHAFAADAVGRGAVALLSERAIEQDVPQVIVSAGTSRQAMAHAAAALEGHPASSLQVIGVTGTNGKTTVTHLLGSILEAHGVPTTVVGTLDGERTTPEAPVLQHLLAEARDMGRKAVAMEVSSHALSQGRVDAMRFSAAVFTNLGQDHLDYHGTMEAYFDAKASLFRPDRADQAIVNADDPWGRRLISSPSIPTTGFSISEISNVEVAPGHTAFSWRGRRVKMGLTGSYNAVNALCAATCAVALGVPEDTVVEGLAAATAVPGRFEVVDVPGPITVIVDFAHTPDGLATAIASARQLAAGRQVVVVFGCGGDRDSAKRPLMGAVANAQADMVVITSDNPRGERREAIIEQVLAGIPDRSRTLVEPERSVALELAIDVAEPGDVVLIAGKGHEGYIEAGGRRYPFDDRIEARFAAARSLDRRKVHTFKGPV
jgi:UDP-N-acetylmuramoyl-L-alanyl-D-glutamate--2,6-diaminopimelate ligase